MVRVLDVIHVIVVVVVAAIAALLITDSWAPRVVIFGFLVALLAFPVKRLMRPAYRRAEATTSARPPAA